MADSGPPSASTAAANCACSSGVHRSRGFLPPPPPPPPTDAPTVVPKLVASVPPGRGVGWVQGGEVGAGEWQGPAFLCCVQHW